MKTTSALYKSLRSEVDAYYEVEVIQGGNTYSIDTLKTLTISPALFTSEDGKAPMIGGVHSTQCNLTLYASSSDWPRMASFTVRIRLSSGDDTQKSEWLTLGTFYTDERTEDKYGTLSIVAFDRMLMTEQYWTDKIPSSLLPSNWPITSKAWCDMCESAGLMEVDSRTTLDDTVAFIGLNTSMTMRDVLKTIAVAHGSNWTITSEGKFRLIPFANMVDGSAAIAGIAIAGISVVGDSTISIDTGVEYAFLGMSVKSFDSSPALPPVSRVCLENEAGTVILSGDTTGYTLNATSEWSATTGLADLCLSNVEDYIYKPFTAGTAFLDPAAEIGDLVIVDGRSYQMMSIDWNINTWPTADISAPYEEEVDHEYTIVSAEAKSYRKSMYGTEEKLQSYPTRTEMSSAIEQTAESIQLSVSETYVTQDDYDTAIANLQSQIDGQISTYSGGVVPTLSNYPANEWTTDAIKSQHVGALYLVTSDSGSPYAGQYYRFEQSGNNFAWVLVEDSALATALATAAAAQESANQALEDAATAQVAADAAQGTADQARLDAVAEAARAQALATAAAAVDATNKANQALADAKAYAELQVSNFVTGEYADDLAAVQEQLDQKIETYYQATDPSSSWDETVDHTGDLWYDTSTELYFRWDGTEWQELTSNPPQGVFDRIDGKARIFVSQPVPPYSVGDMWTQGANGDILRCETEREDGEQFHASDWKLASKYTDDSALAQFLRGEFADTINALKLQLDQKAETFYQADDPSNDGKNWDTIAGRAIVGVSIVGSTLDLHVGDMWYRTTDDKTFRWDGTQWVEQTISKEMFDMVDGRAQIFVGVSNPTPPYNTGDLWFIDNTSEILTCVNSKTESQSYASSDWVKYNKYTDDTKANSVDTDLQGYKQTVTSTFEVQSRAINAKVEKTGGNQSSFGWTLTDSSWTLYANNNEVFTATSTGIEIDGSGTFSGNLNAAGGTFSGELSAATGTFSGDLNSGSIHIGKVSDGQGHQVDAFAVDSGGNLTARSASIIGSISGSSITGGTISGADISGGTINGGTITGGTISGSTVTGITISGSTVSGTSISGGTISIGGSESTPAPFQVSSSGALTATGATITGTIYASDGTFSGDISGARGTFTGSLSGSSISGGTISGTSILGSTIEGGTLALGGQRSQSGEWSVTPKFEVDSGGNVNIQQGTISIGTIGSGSSAQPVFHVDSSGNLTSRSINVQAGSISIGTTTISGGTTVPTFHVDQDGNLTARSGTFDGTVYAKNIAVGTTEGYITGSQIGIGELTGGEDGNIDLETITGINVEPLSLGAGLLEANSLTDDQIGLGGISTASLSSGVGQSLGYADLFNSSTSLGTETYPSYFTAGRLISMGSILTDDVEIRSSAQGEGNVTLGGHYHSILVNQDGTITIGSPYNDSSPPSFRIADTAYFQQNYVRAVSAAQETPDSQIRWSSDDKTLTADFNLIAKNGLTPATAIFTEEDYPIAMPAGKAYDAGIEAVSVTALSVGAVNEPTLDEDRQWISQADAVATISATKADGTTVYSRNVTLAGRNINVTAAYNKGKRSETVSTIEIDTSRSISYSSSALYHTLTVPVKATTQSGTVTTGTLYSVDASEAWRDGKDSGAQSAYCSEVGILALSNLTVRGSSATCQASVRGKASAILGNGNIYTNNRYTYNETLYDIDVTSIYNSGKNAGQAEATIDHFALDGTATFQSNKYYSVPIKACKSDNSTLKSGTISFFGDVAYNEGAGTAFVYAMSYQPNCYYLDTSYISLYGSGNQLIKLSVPVRGVARGKKANGTDTVNSDPKDQRVDYDITSIWNTAASQGIDAGRDDAINGLSMNSNNISYPTVLGNSYGVGTQRFVNFTASASVNGTVYHDGTYRTVSASRTESMNVTSIFNQGVEEGESHVSHGMSWEVYRHWDYYDQRYDGYDLIVYCGDASHTFWSASNIYP